MSLVVVLCLCGCADVQEDPALSGTTPSESQTVTGNEWYHKFWFDDSGVDVNIRTEQDMIAGLRAVSERYQYSGYLEFHVYTKGAVDTQSFSGIEYFELIDDDLFYTLKIKTEDIDDIDTRRLVELANLPSITKISVTGPNIHLPE